MLRKILRTKAQSVLEYTMLLTLVIVVFVLFSTYIKNALSGGWKKAGDVFGHGRRYDPDSTVRCGYDWQYTDRWYDLECYENTCQEECVHEATKSASACAACITGCNIPPCSTY